MFLGRPLKFLINLLEEHVHDDGVTLRRREVERGLSPVVLGPWVTTSVQKSLGPHHATVHARKVQGALTVLVPTVDPDFFYRKQRN